MSFYAYILCSVSSGRYYVGHTSNVARRLTEHHRDHTVSLKNRGPWALVYSEEFSTRSEAARRERQIKAMKSKVWIERLVRASR